MFDREPVISALHLWIRAPSACSAPTPGQRRGTTLPLCSHVGGNPGHVLSGQQASSQVLPDSLTPTAPHLRSLSGPCWLGDNMLWCVFGWSCMRCWAEVPTRPGPPHWQHSADCTSSHSHPRQPPHSHVLEKIIGWLEVQHHFTQQIRNFISALIRGQEISSVQSQQRRQFHFTSADGGRSLRG